MIVGVLKEAAPETRVSLIAEGAAQLVKKNISVWIESGAGMNAYCSDDDYRAVGAEIKSAAEIAAGADVNVQGTNSGKTPLHHAAWNGDLTMIEALLAAGAKPNLRDRLAVDRDRYPLPVAHLANDRRQARLGFVEGVALRHESQ